MLSETVKSKGKLDRSSLLHGGLDFLWLEITNRCNLQCVHCYADSAPHMPLSEAMNYEDWIEVLSDGADLGCRQVQFIGGEPTVHPRLLDLIDFARERGYEFIEVYTNGTRLTESLCSAFALRGVNVAVSMYGDTPEVHDAVTAHHGSYSRTIDGIRQALAHDIPVRVGIIAMNANEERVSHTVAQMEALGVKSIKVDRARGIGRGNDHVFGVDPFSELCGNCWRGSLAVNSKGDVSPCIFSHFNNVGRISDGLKNIVASRSLGDFRSKMLDMADDWGLAEERGNCPPACSPCGPDQNCNPWCNPGCTPGSKRR
jgi:MoaA/NifB/PqqE/SkfB family radical SAM enzyme